MLDKSIKLTENQYNATVIAHRVLGRLLAKAAHDDKTPFEVTVSELLEVAGAELMGK